MFSMFIFLIPKVIIQRYGVKMVPLHVITVALWVAYMLNVTFGAPFIFGVVSVGIGEAVAEMVIGRILYDAMESRKEWLL